MSDVIVVETRLSEIKSEIHQHLKRQWDDVLEIGKLAIEAKSLIPHGGFTNWITDELGLSPRLIQGYMRVHERFSQTEKFAALPVSALLMLASPSVQDGVLAEIGGQIDEGKKFTIEGVENVIDRYRVLEGTMLGSRALLENFGTKADGSPAKVISRSAITSLETVATDGLQRGAVTIEGIDVPVTLSLPPAIAAAMQQETKRRQSEHVDDNVSTKVYSGAVVCDIPEDDALRDMGYVTLRVYDRAVVEQLSKGQQVTVSFEVES